MTATLKTIVGKDLRQQPGHCDRHGAFISFAPAAVECWSSCPRCHEERTLREYKRWVAETISPAAVEGLPLRFKCRRFEDFNVANKGQAHALAFARDYATDFKVNAGAAGRCALFIGGVGTGKTTLAAAVGAAIAAQGVSCSYSTVRAALRRIKDTWRPTAEETESQALTALINPGFLILDEVGVQFCTAAEEILLYDIINGRYENLRPILLISNLDAAGVRTVLGDRGYDRLREAGGQAIAFDWESYRGGSGTTSEC